MARPRSEDKRDAILTAATDLIAAQGLGAATAKIARQAGVAGGTLFIYFANKDALLNQLYLGIKTDLRDAMMADFPEDRSLIDRCRHVWDSYIDWAGAFPAKRRAMVQLVVSDRITDAGKAAGRSTLREIEGLLQECFAAGALKDQPIAFGAAILEALAETTLTFIAQEPDKAAHYKRLGFDAFWRVISA